jgi:FtsH-binding integral membrane protein
MYPYGQRTVVTSSAGEAATIFLAKVFNWMAAGLGVTALTAFAVASSPAMLRLIFGTPLIYLLIFGELGMVFYLSARIEKIRAGTATILFLVYSALNGATLSAVLLAYTTASVTSAFLVAGLMFGAMAVYGTVTKRDLTSMGSFMFMGLVGMIIAGLVNFFLKSAMMDFVISGIGVIVFTGLTAYDVQKIQALGSAGIMNDSAGVVRKGAIMGALALYLDFINLFLSLLRLMGDRR